MEMPRLLIELDSKRACRLCLEFSEHFVDIFQDFEDSTIATIVSQHFWFQIYKGDGFSDFLCQACWTTTKNFHNFYKKVEAQQTNHLESIGFVEQHTFQSHANETANNCSSNVIKVERSPSPSPTVEEPNEEIVKTEEMDPAISIDVHIQTDESFDSDYDPSESADSEGNQSSYDEEQSPKVKRKSQNINVCESENSKLDVIVKKSPHQRVNTRATNRTKKCQTTNTSVTDTATEDSQIREFFKMECEMCSAHFETFIEVKNHYRMVHNTTGYLTCCRKKFRVRWLVVHHLRRHLNPDEYRCDPCDKRFANKISLKNHIENHGPFESRAYECDMCSSRFTRSSKLVHHKRIRHCSEEDKKYRCDICTKNFVSKSILAYHIRSVHEFAYAHVCDICARVFKREQNFKMHMQLHTAVVRPKVQCNVCGVLLKHADSLRSHMRLHKYTTVSCTICDKVLKNKKSLTSHIRDVHGEKRHQCTMCDKAFSKAFRLKEHMASHTGEVLYNCPYCAKPFKSKTNMYGHRKKEHFADWTRDRLERSAPSTTD